MNDMELSINHNINKIFLATPITSLMERPDQYNPLEQKSIETIIKTLRLHLQTKVFCAIEREEYGKDLMSGIECTKPDYLGLVESDVMLAFPDHSYGVHIELGWASAVKKPIVVCVNRRIGIKTPLIEGLMTLTSVAILDYQSDAVLPTHEVWTNELFSDVITAFDSLEMQPCIKTLDKEIMNYGYS
jgi:hypothetical protein